MKYKILNFTFISSKKNHIINKKYSYRIIKKEEYDKQSKASLMTRKNLSKNFHSQARKRKR